MAARPGAPAPEHPPPAPDWILGDDGHWKPPSFDAGAGGGAGPRPAGPTGPGPNPAGPGPGPPRSRRGVWRRRATITWGAIIVVLTPLGWGLKALDIWDGADTVVNGTEPSSLTDDSRSSSSDSWEPPIAPSPSATGPMASGADSLVPAGAAPGDEGHPCPSFFEVNDLTGRSDQMWVDLRSQVLVNGVPILGVTCTYGELLTVGELAPGTDAVTALAASQGEAEVGGHEAGERAVQLVEPGGAVRVVFEVAGRQRWVRVEPEAAATLEPLLQVMATRGV